MADSTHLTTARAADLALEKNALMRRATWCGIVFALGVLLAALNVVPPVDVHYRIVSQAVVSASRLQQLQIAQAASSGHRSSPGSLPDRSQPFITAVHVLDRTKGDLTPNLGERKNGTEDQLILVKIESRWARRCTEEEYAVWLNELTRIQPSTVEGSAIAKALRSARWELEAAEHYASQQQFLSSRETGSSTTDGRTFQLASNTSLLDTDSDLRQGSSAPAQDETSTPTVEAKTAQLQSTEASSGQLADQLAAQVVRAREKVAETELAWQRQIDQSSGEVRISGALQLAAASSSIPLWMAASVLILGMASGSAAGWFQHRLQAGGVYAPEVVARQLAKAGVPSRGKLVVASDSPGIEDWVGFAGTRASHISRWIARQLTRLSEVFLALWCLLIVGRLVVDPLWRGVLAESPLAAFGRLLAGLP